MNRIIFFIAFIALSTLTCCSADDTSSPAPQPGTGNGGDTSSPYPDGGFYECDYSPSATSFAVWSPSASEAELRLYRDATGEPVEVVPLAKGGHNLWQTTVSRDLNGLFYTFRVKAGGKWLNETPGIYARAVCVGGQRAAVLPMSETDPEGWATDRSPVMSNAADIVVYEMHYRDFTIDAGSGVSGKGKYISLTEGGARTPDGQAAGIDHLKELGVTHVQLLPSADFASIDETALDRNVYNWGYEPQNYNVPEGSYSTDPATPATRIREFKQMVQALHNAGIRVIMDVVYNHTWNTAYHCFEQTAPGYFYRYKADGTPADASACGNETASEKEMMRRYMVESLAYWAEEYHIDGFRFDLMAIHDLETMSMIRERLSRIDPSIVLYGEGWAASAPAYDNSLLAFKANTWRMPGVGAFSDDMRDGLRGSLDATRGGFISGTAECEEAVKFGIVGGIAHPQVSHGAAWAAEPTQHVSYVTCHDDHCLRDRIALIAPEADEEERLRMDKLAQTAVLTSQGIPFIFCGEEMYRTKQGVGNSYNSPDGINAIDWSLKARYNDLFNYYKDMITLRRAHPGFYLGSADAVRAHLEFLDVNGDNVVAFRIKDLQGIDTAKSIVVILNGSKRAYEAAVPEALYTLLAHDGQINPDGMDARTMSAISVPATSATILAEY